MKNPLLNIIAIKYSSIYVANFSIYNWDISALGVNVCDYTFSYIKYIHLFLNINSNTTLPTSILPNLSSITPTLSSLFTQPYPIISTLKSVSLNAHLNLTTPLLNVHSLEFKLLVGLCLFVILCLVIYLINLVISIFNDLKSYIKEYTSESNMSKYRKGWEWNQQWSKYSKKYSSKEQRFSASGSGDDGDDKDDKGNGRKNIPADKILSKEELLNKAKILLSNLRTPYILSSYIRGYDSAVNHTMTRNNREYVLIIENREHWTTLGIFERYSLDNLNRKGSYSSSGLFYPEERPHYMEWPGEWEYLYERTLEFIQELDPNFIPEELPSNFEQLSQAVQELGLPPLFRPLYPPLFPPNTPK